MAKSSPTQKSLALMRRRGYTCAIVEKWNSHTMVRQDLFGFADILCVGPDGTIAVQSTSLPNIASRERKITGRYIPKDKKEEDRMLRVRANVVACLSAGWKIEVHGFDMKKPRTPANIRHVTEEDLVPFGQIEENEELPF